MKKSCSSLGSNMEQERPMRKHGRKGISATVGTAVVAGLMAGLSLNAALAETAAGLPAEGELTPFLGEPEFDSQRLFEGERFPNVVVTTEGTVLATWGGRRAQFGPPRTFRYRRSEDGGCNWGEEIILQDPGFQGGAATVDDNTGDIFLFVEEEHRPADLTVYRSADDGASWKEEFFIPKEAIHSTDDGYGIRPHPDGYGIPGFHFSGAGITLRHGPHRGRLIAPAQVTGHSCHAIYSDDGGKTWDTSEPVPFDGTFEGALAELSDGRILYMPRVSGTAFPRDRWAAISEDGGETWKSMGQIRVLPDGPRGHDNYGCAPSLVRLPVLKRDILIYANPYTGGDSGNQHRRRHGRGHGTVWASFDGGVTWPVRREVTPGGFEYASLAAGRPGTPSEGKIYLLYEAGGHPDTNGVMARFNLSWILEGDKTGDGEVPEL